MHGAGNDFVVLDLRADKAAPDAALCRLLADRQRGVGCDQILTIELPTSPKADVRYRIWNADGSLAGQCGNGARCVAAWYARELGETVTRLWLESPAGLHLAERLDHDQWRIDLGIPRFAPADIPLRGFAEAADAYRLQVNDAVFHIGAASMGNPHALLEVADLAALDIAPVARALQVSDYFPDSVNVGFAEILSRTHIALRVYERGAGETLACGSGACAAAAILMRRGRVERRVRVDLPGGTLHVEWPGNTHGILMQGPATFVFQGVVDARFMESVAA
ncbi:diaminopimelate epimerase [Lysobacteraceae bacterium NML08-0793]|nr:diaminopimelate epimerase [Xanthomonadaceae bacterium NML08-0793]